MPQGSVSAVQPTQPQLGMQQILSMLAQIAGGGRTSRQQRSENRTGGGYYVPGPFALKQGGSDVEGRRRAAAVGRGGGGGSRRAERTQNARQQIIASNAEKAKERTFQSAMRDADRAIADIKNDQAFAQNLIDNRNAMERTAAYNAANPLDALSLMGQGRVGNVNIPVMDPATELQGYSYMQPQSSVEPGMGPRSMEDFGYPVDPRLTAFQEAQAQVAAREAAPPPPPAEPSLIQQADIAARNPLQSLTPPAAPPPQGGFLQGVADFFTRNSNPPNYQIPGVTPEELELAKRTRGASLRPTDRRGNPIPFSAGTNAVPPFFGMSDVFGSTGQPQQVPADMYMPRQFAPPVVAAPVGQRLPMSRRPSPLQNLTGNYYPYFFPGN